MRSLAPFSATAVAVALLGACAGEKAKESDATTSGGASAPPALPAPPVSATPLESARTRARELEARAVSFRVDSGTWSAGGATSEYGVLLEHNQPAILEEKLGLGEKGASLSRFWYENGRLFLYEERGVRTSTKNVGYQLTVETRQNVAIAFDTTGAVIGSSYEEDGKELPLPDSKAKEARTRSKALVEQVRKKQK